ncbi:MAG: helicase-related protein [Actinomycetota bacterium]
MEFHEWAAIWERGIAVHHAGLLPLFKEIIEGLFKEGHLKVVFATETLALGINMPARTVVLEKLIKWNGESHVMITPGEYTQLTGRAGRRGIDIEGNSVILWTPAIDAAMAGSLAGTRTYPLRSSFTPTYNMSANLINRLPISRVLDSLSLSYAQFQADRSLSGVIEQIAKNQEALALPLPTCDQGDFASYFSIRLEIKELEKASINERGSRRHKALEERAERITVLRRSMRDHQCHSCPERDDHSRIYEKRSKLERDTVALSQKVESRRKVIPRTFERVLQVLRELGYVESERLTDSGKTLLGIFAESDLLVAELIKTDLLSSLEVADLPVILSGLLFEARGEEKQLPRIPKSISEAVRDVVTLWARLETIEGKHGLATQREPDFSMSWSVSRWSHGGSISSVLRESDLSIGDFVRHIKQIIDLLGQLISSDTMNSARYQEALKSVDRGIIRYASVSA